jgi:hypothetical protein
MTTQTFIIFQHEVLGHLYLWNGKYPVGITGGWDFEQDPWHPSAELSPEEEKVFKSLESSKARGFEFKERGRFNIIKRINVEIYDN